MGIELEIEDDEDGEGFEEIIETGPRRWLMPIVRVGDSVWFFADRNKRHEAPRHATIVAIGNDAVDLALWTGMSFIAKNAVKHANDPIFTSNDPKVIERIAHLRENGVWIQRRKPRKRGSEGYVTDSE